MLILQKNKRNDLYICFARRDVRKLTCLTAKFQEEAIEPHREIAHSSFGAVKKCWLKKLGVNALLPMLFQQVFSIR